MRAYERWAEHCVSLDKQAEDPDFQKRVVASLDPVAEKWPPSLQVSQWFTDQFARWVCGELDKLAGLPPESILDNAPIRPVQGPIVGLGVKYVDHPDILYVKRVEPNSTGHLSVTLGIGSMTASVITDIYLDAWDQSGCLWPGWNALVRTGKLRIVSLPPPAAGMVTSGIGDAPRWDLGVVRCLTPAGYVLLDNGISLPLERWTPDRVIVAAYLVNRGRAA